MKFKDIQLITDARVTSDLRHCLVCGEPLRLVPVSDAPGLLPFPPVSFHHCARCNRLYMVDRLLPPDEP